MLKAIALFKPSATTVVLTLSLVLQLIDGAKILSATFLTPKSHKITYDPLLLELSQRGHDVTSLSPVPSSSNKTNPREVLTIDFQEFMQRGPDLFQQKAKGEAWSPFSMLAPFESYCRELYALPQVREIMTQKYDLVLTEPFMNECGAGFIHKLNTTLVLYVPVSAPGDLVRQLGGPAPPSFIPNLYSNFDSRMDFVERLRNFLEEAFMVLLNRLYFVPTMEALYREALNDSTIPGFQEIIRNSSLLLSYSHFILGGTRPFMPDVIEVGGMHLREAKPLPKELDDFLNASGEDGFIFFSMGSILQGSSMPESYRLIFRSAFARLKQRILWKWETETMPDLPPNVRLIKWAPQQDILGHPKIRAFITHGGLGSTTESIYHGVPLIGIPMIGDQLTNMEKFVRQGLGVQLDFKTLSEDDVVEAVETILKDSKYETNIETIAKIFRDQLDNPLERAVYWIEYVLRHKGAVQLRSPARDLNLFQYHSLDVIGAIFLSITVSLYIVWKLIYALFSYLCSRNRDVVARGKALKNGKKRN